MIFYLVTLRSVIRSSDCVDSVREPAVGISLGMLVQRAGRSNPTFN